MSIDTKNPLVIAGLILGVYLLTSRKAGATGINTGAAPMVQPRQASTAPVRQGAGMDFSGIWSGVSKAIAGWGAPAQAGPSQTPWQDKLRDFAGGGAWVTPGIAASADVGLFNATKSLDDLGSITGGGGLSFGGVAPAFSWDGNTGAQAFGGLPSMYEPGNYGAV